MTTGFPDGLKARSQALPVGAVSIAPAADAPVSAPCPPARRKRKVVVELRVRVWTEAVSVASSDCGSFQVTWSPLEVSAPPLAVQTISGLSVASTEYTSLKLSAA